MTPPPNRAAQSWAVTAVAILNVVHGSLILVLALCLLPLALLGRVLYPDPDVLSPLMRKLAQDPILITGAFAAGFGVCGGGYILGGHELWLRKTRGRKAALVLNCYDVFCALFVVSFAYVVGDARPLLVGIPYLTYCVLVFVVLFRPKYVAEFSQPDA